MNALRRFQEQKRTLTSDQFINYCNRIISEKENYAKIVVQRAQQHLNNV